MNTVKKVLNPAVRRYVYGVATAALGVAVVRGYLDQSEVNAWNALLTAVTGMAFLHVPAKSGDKDEA